MMRSRHTFPFAVAAMAALVLALAVSSPAQQIIGGIPASQPAPTSQPATQPAQKVQWKPKKLVTDPTKFKLPEAEFTEDGKYRKLTLDDLAGYRLKMRFTRNELGEVIMHAEGIGTQIPKALDAVHDKPIEIRGYVVPVTLVEDKVIRFMLVPTSLHCLYCQPPGMNEYIDVSLADAKKLKNAMGVIVRGKLQVGVKLVDGVVESIYRLKADDVEVMKDL